MKKQSTAERLKIIMHERNLKQVDILRLCEPFCKKYDIRLGRNDLSQYVSGKVNPSQNKLSILSFALDVDEAWLMGYSVPRKANTELPKPTDNNLFINKTLKGLRLEKGLSLNEFASEFGITVEDLKAYEDGTKSVPFEFVKKISDYFKIDLSKSVGLNFYRNEDECDWNASLRTLEITKRWNDEVGETRFTDEEVTELINYAKFIISKRNAK